jgi:hypothetical protein
MVVWGFSGDIDMKSSIIKACIIISTEAISRKKPVKNTTNIAYYLLELGLP